jgi:G3E family GTPase
MTSLPRIPVLVIGGYLGAGKTTLINQILHNATQRIAVVVNDFGSVNIDAALIAAKHDDTIELTNGCICCAVGESLADVLFTISDRPTLPELVIIEASGVANPASVAAFAHIEGFHHLGNVVLVDATQALATSKDPLVGRTFALQVEAAHLLAITKSDEATDSVISEVRTIVSSLAPSTPLVLTTSTTLSSLIMNLAPRADSAVTETHTEFNTTTLSHVSAQDDKQLLAFLQNFPPNVVRAKGIVELANGDRRLVQKVGSTVSITHTDLLATGLVLISLK